MMLLYASATPPRLLARDAPLLDRRLLLPTLKALKCPDGMKYNFLLDERMPELAVSAYLEYCTADLGTCHNFN
ncbi:hypothetical protein LA080_008292 [Diaporthe eres]|nr:hypothetical protein LA080_008292 [Diaporthe eres]